jgi:hypothetical protein
MRFSRKFLHHPRPPECFVGVSTLKQVAVLRGCSRATRILVTVMLLFAEATCTVDVFIRMSYFTTFSAYNLPLHVNSV